MPRIVKQITYGTRSITFTGTATFVSMGKYVTDFLARFKGDGWVVTTIPDDADVAVFESDAQELECVVAVLNAHDVPVEIAPGVPYSVHGRVQAAIDLAKKHGL